MNGLKLAMLESVCGGVGGGGQIRGVGVEVERTKMTMVE